jgi:glutamine cyclotransferase
MASPRPIMLAALISTIAAAAWFRLSETIPPSSPPARVFAEQSRRAIAPVPIYGYKVIRSYPHDTAAFTQGLTYHEGVLYEGTGLHGRSSIRKVKLETGEVLQIRRLDAQYFGEGIALWKDSLVQLTWQSGIGFVYDLQTFQPRRTFQYAGEGWGLTHDGRRLIMSDGSDAGTLRFLDPATFRETGTLIVRDGATPVKGLNELEFVKGEIYANVWNTDRIAQIAPRTGQVTGWIDVGGLLHPREAAGADVLNGIAYDAITDRLFVTGKLWPKVFEIDLVLRK